MAVIEILFSWDLIRAMTAVWEAHKAAVPMFNKDDYTEAEIAAICTNEQKLLTHGNARVVKEMQEITASMGHQAVIDRIVMCKVIE